MEYVTSPQNDILVALRDIALEILPPASVPVPASWPPPEPPPPPPEEPVENIQICIVYCPVPEYRSTQMYTLLPPTEVPLDVTSSVVPELVLKSIYPPPLFNRAKSKSTEDE